MTKQIKDKFELEEWLVAKKIDISEWDSGEAKTVEDLWHEIAAGESYLQDDPPLRLFLGVVEVIIRTRGRVLVEAEQILKDGRRRYRNTPPGEKLKPGESYAGAAIRCLEEEMGIARKDIEIIESSYKKHSEIKESPSYPNLKTLYNFHIVEVRVKGIPETDFETIEVDSQKPDPVFKHIWEWRRLETFSTHWITSEPH